jgi:hypothetical protein
VNLSPPADRFRFPPAAALLFLFALLAACILRFPSRELKPMHADETTQALKLREALAGQYHYDPRDHHGPTLLYSTIPLLKLSGTDWNHATESNLRLTPALYGVALLFLLWLVRDALPPDALGWAALFLAVSPIMVFYSRYFIMEILLTVFTFASIASGWRFFITRKTPWLVASGLSAGLMHATKETCILHFAALTAALIAIRLLNWFSPITPPAPDTPTRPFLSPRSAIIFTLSATVASVSVFSKGFTEWQGVADSIGTYFQMFSRAGGQGHEKPFSHYAALLWGGSFGTTAIPFPSSPSSLTALLSNPARLAMILGIKADPRIIVLSEALLVILAAIGCLAAFSPSRLHHHSLLFLRFLAIFSIALFLIYSIIPYKTPWCIITPWLTLIIIAGFGTSQLLRLVSPRPLHFLTLTILSLATAQLGLQAWRASRNFASTAANPYNYSMTSRDALDAVQRIRRLASLHPAGNAMVIAQHDENGAWPLPWFLARQFPNYQWQGGTLDTDLPSVLLLSGPAEATLDKALAASGNPDTLSSDFARMPVSLTPSTGLTMFVRKSLWDQYTAHPAWPPTPVQE